MIFNITEQKDAIRTLYIERGGIETLFQEFLNQTQQYQDLGMDDGYNNGVGSIDTLSALVSANLSARFRGEKVRTTIADVINHNGERYFDLHTKTFKNL